MSRNQKAVLSVDVTQNYNDIQLKQIFDYYPLLAQLLGITEKNKIVQTVIQHNASQNPC